MVVFALKFGYFYGVVLSYLKINDIMSFQDPFTQIQNYQLVQKWFLFCIFVCVMYIIELERLVYLLTLVGKRSLYSDPTCQYNVRTWVS